MFWTGPLSLMSRAVRNDALSWKWHAVRFASAAFLLLLLIQAQVMTLGRGASGRTFFEFIAHLNFWLMTLIGLGFFPSVITEEKEEGTLPLLILSGMPGVSILLAKAGGRLWSILLIFLAQLPFSLLALMLGGLTAAQVLAVWFGLGCYLAALAGMGVVWSVVSREGYRASRGMILSVVLLNWIEPIVRAVVAWLRELKVLGVAAPTPPFAAALENIGRAISIQERIRLTLASEANVRFLQSQSLVHFAIGLVSFLLAVALFRRATEYAHEPIVRPFGLARARSHRPTRRPWGDPLAWKEFQFLASGFPGFALQSLVLAIVLALAFRFDEIVARYLHVTAPQFAVTGLVALALSELAYVANRTLSWEARAGTLSTLAMLPRPLVGTLLSKLLGGLMGAAPPLVALAFIGSFCDLGLLLPKAGMWDFLSLGAVVLAFLHLIALYSLFHPWAAIPLAIGTLLLSGALLLPFVGLTSYAFAGMNYESFASVVVVYFAAIATLGMQVAIVLKVRHLAGS